MATSLKLHSLLSSKLNSQTTQLALSSSSSLLWFVSLSPLSSAPLRSAPKLRLRAIRASSSSSSSPITIAEPQGIKIKSIPTKPIEGQKTGTSGFHKKVKVFMQENYLTNWIQALFDSLLPEDYKNGLLVLVGDGRYFNREAAQERAFHTVPVLYEKYEDKVDAFAEMAMFEIKK